MPTRKHLVIIAEFSIHPIGATTSVGKYVLSAINALSKIPGIKYEVTPMATILEAEKITTILQAVDVAHKALRKMGAKRISSTLRIDERLDKSRTMQDKVRSLNIP